MKTSQKVINYNNHVITLRFDDYDDYGIGYSIVLDEPVTDTRGMLIRASAIDKNVAIDIYNGLCADEAIESAMKVAFDNLFVEINEEEQDFSKWY